MLNIQWESPYPLGRLVSVAISTALPRAFLAFASNQPDSWAARHQNEFGNALHVIALVTLANQSISVQDIVVTALVMVSFEVFRRSSLRINGADQETKAAIGELLSSTHSVIADSDINTPAQKDHLEAPDYAKTPDKSNLADLTRTQHELRSTRKALSETYAENSALRDEIKTIKATVGRDHQAAIYRKDIELFALRKSIELKESCILERDAKLEEHERQKKAALDLKESQLRTMKETVAFLERQRAPRLDSSDSVTGEQKTAVQVKLLRVNGRSSIEEARSSEDKDTEIAELKAELVEAQRTSETLPPLQDELRRAWDASSEVQNALNEERTRHVQTQEKLQEAALRLEEEARRNSQKNSPARLPTIEEQDQRELEAMFNAAQQDNLRLYSELEAKDKDLRNSTARLSATEEEIKSLSEQLRFEKAINVDMETARPSLVHRVHYQRLESQAKEARDQLVAKDEELQALKLTHDSKENRIEELIQERTKAERTKTDLEEENDRLKQSVSQLESTKEQLMLDHERLAKHRARERTTSAEHASARSSGATLITEPVIVTSDVPLPSRPVTIAGELPTAEPTPDNSNRFSTISNDPPPLEPRSSRRKSLTLKGLMRKMVRKDDETQESKEQKKDSETARPKTALTPKDKNASLRPKTAVEKSTKEAERPKTAAPAKNEAERPKTAAPTTTSEATNAMMPGTARQQKENTAVESPRPKSRGWSTSRKLRKSLG
ncbi:hypothetical protein EJ04DRAFT_493942 [Polyplosphaeria fusca]|uniref:Uncharacterized protein n=1 Tax=Polyplosphaeria fusca TaxID=682080 RepID=A0A9P4UZF7_9PLEO|nr:hypothetical protein EJ04DRAFT_493942 [Polyplosphaeria fusca]